MTEREWDEDETDDFDIEDEGGQWELDPTDPSHPDFDLSEAAEHSDWEQRRGLLPLRRWVILLVTIVIIITLFWPACAHILV
jgi:hypothetical protein